MPSNALKVCTFNAKIDDFDYKCCIKDSCYERKCGSTVPDSLLAALIAIKILPGKADVYNIQNVKNRCIVEHLLKEIARVKYITDEIEDPCRTYSDERSFIYDIACRLNAFTGLCEDGVAYRDMLACCEICDLDYVTYTQSIGANDSNFSAISQTVRSYAGVFEYDAFYAGTCLTLVKKNLKLCPETQEIPCIDSIVLFFEYCGKRLVNVNVNLGCLVNSFDEVGNRAVKVDNLICYLKKYENCGAVMMTGAFGDIDYDIRQLRGCEHPRSCTETVGQQHRYHSSSLGLPMRYQRSHL